MVGGESVFWVRIDREKCRIYIASKECLSFREDQYLWWALRPVDFFMVGVVADISEGKSSSWVPRRIDREKCRRD